MVEPTQFIFRYLMLLLPVTVVCVVMFWDHARLAPVPRAAIPLALALVAGIIGMDLDARSTFTEAAFVAYFLDSTVILALLGAFMVKIQSRLYAYIMLMVAQVTVFIVGAEDYVLYQFGPIELGNAFWIVSGVGVVALVPALIACLQLVQPDILEFSEESLWTRLSISPAIASLAMIIYFLNIIVIQRVLSPWVIIVYAGIFVAFLVNNISTTRIVADALRSERYSAELTEANQLLASQKEQYRLITRNIEDARKARHDMRHQIGVIESMLTEKSPEVLSEYVEEFKKQLPPEIEHRYCENYAVNTILGEYGRRAGEKGVAFDVQMQVPETDEGDSLTLAILVGNCLENAFEATEQLPEDERSVSIRSIEHGDMLNFVVKNTYNGRLEEKDGTYLSHKRGFKEPGIGLTSIRRIVEDHDGIMRIGVTGDEFALSLSMNVDRPRKA